MSFLKRTASKTRTDQGPRGKLAILMPTYRFDEQARHTIAGMCSLASDEIAVVIGDNSENPKKWDFLRKLASLSDNVHVHCHKTNIGATRNWCYLFEQTRLPFYIVISDDDLCSPPFILSALRQLEAHGDAAASAGWFLMVRSNQEVFEGNRQRTEEDAYSRCINFRIGGGNSLPNSMGRLSFFQSYIGYLRGHPLKATFFDWMLAYSLLGRGKYYTEDVGIYLYDMSNWETAEACWKNDARCYVEFGLPTTFTWFHNLYWAVESAHFFLGSYTPVSNSEESIACAQFVYRDRINYFRGQCELQSNYGALEKVVSHRPAAEQAFRCLLENDDAGHPRLFDWFSELIAAFDPTCALAYRDFVQSSIDARFEMSAEHKASASFVAAS